MRRTELYEPERKEAFLAACYSDETQKENVRTLLESLGEQEKRIGKDFCQMTPEEVHTALVGVVGSRYRSSTARKVPLQKYVSWCIENGIPGANPVLDGVSFTDAGKDKLASQSVGNPTQLQKYMDCIFDREEADTVDLIYRGFFWLAFCGIREETQALELPESAVDIGRNLIHFQGKDYEILPEARQVISKCKILHSFYYSHPHYDTVLRPRAIGTRLLRGYKEDMNIKTIRCALARKTKEHKFANETDMRGNKLNLFLSYDRVWLSGRFYDTWIREQAGPPISFQALAQEFTEGKTYAVSGGRNKPEARLRWVETDYRRDYLNWKRVHGYV